VSVACARLGALDLIPAVIARRVSVGAAQFAVFAVVMEGALHLWHEVSGGSGRA
jgi:hypothetical protein